MLLLLNHDEQRRISSGCAIEGLVFGLRWRVKFFWFKSFRRKRWCGGFVGYRDFNGCFRQDLGYAERDNYIVVGGVNGGIRSRSVDVGYGGCKVVCCSSQWKSRLRGSMGVQRLGFGERQREMFVERIFNTAVGEMEDKKDL
ncbi:unnamed protein product [Lathyrus oleraceus]